MFQFHEFINHIHSVEIVLDLKRDTFHVYMCCAHEADPHCNGQLTYYILYIYIYAYFMCGLDVPFNTPLSSIFCCVLVIIRDIPWQWIITLECVHVFFRRRNSLGSNVIWRMYISVDASLYYMLFFLSLFSNMYSHKMVIIAAYASATLDNSHGFLVCAHKNTEIQLRSFDNICCHLSIFMYYFKWLLVHSVPSHC